jgi:hypothetical protein
MLWAAVAVWNETQSDGCLVDRKLKCSYPIDELIFRSKDSFHLGLLGLGDWAVSSRLCESGSSRGYRRFAHSCSR